MCFSAEASYGLSAALLPAGVYCVSSAFQKNKALLGLAIIPLGFGVQQFCEGLIWQNLEHGNRSIVLPAAFVFLYFALSFWPLWIPLCAFLTEANVEKRKLLACFVFAGLLGGLMLFVPLVLDSKALILEVRYHSLSYDISRSIAFDVMPMIGWQIAYLIVVGTPLLISPSRGFAYLGISLILAAVVSHVVFWYAFASVWCFFAAVLSLYLCFAFWKLPLRGATNDRHVAMG